MELGPFLMKEGTETFTRNEWAWNKEANLIFIESPPGVGKLSINQFKFNNLINF